MLARAAIAASRARSRVPAPPFRLHSGHSHGGGGGFHRLPESSSPANARTINAVIGAGAFSDLILVGIKGSAGLVTGSSALLSDAVHSISDVLISLLSGITARFSTKQPDLDHPFGHGKLDSLGALAVSTLLVATGGTIGVKAFDSVQAILQGKTPEPMLSSLLSHAHAATASDAAASAASAAASSLPTEMLLSDPTVAGLAIAACLASVGLKEAVFRWTMKVGLQMRSQALIANALHHRADSLSSGVAAAGIVGAWAGFPVFDPLAAMAVAVMIAKAGGETGINAVKELMDARLDEDVIREAVDIFRAQKDVVGIRRVRSRRSGPSVLVDAELAIAPDVTVGSADELAKAIRAQVFRERREVSELLIHFVPADEHDSKVSPDYREGIAASSASPSTPATATASASTAHGSVPMPVLPRYSMEELKEMVRAAILALPASPSSPSSPPSPFRTITALDVHAESASSRLLHVHCRVVVDPGMAVRDALGAIRAAQARLKQLQLPVSKPAVAVAVAVAANASKAGNNSNANKKGSPSAGAGAGAGAGGAAAGAGAVWTVAIADVQLETNPL